MHISHSVLIFIASACILPNVIRSTPPPPPPPAAAATPPATTQPATIGTTPPASPPGSQPGKTASASATSGTPAAQTTTPEQAGAKEKPPTPEEIAEFIKKATEEQEKVAKEVVVVDAKLRETEEQIIKAPDAPVDDLKPDPFEEAVEERRRRRRRLWRRGYSKTKPYLTVGKKITIKHPTATIYKIEKYLGGGSYGEVYRAEMITTTGNPKKVAIKSCPRYYIPDNGGPKKISKYYKDLDLEFSLLREIFKRDSHCREYLVNPIAKAHTSDLGLMSMELAEFGTLDDYVTKNNLDVRKYFPKMIKEIIYGIMCMLKTGYSHGDLKPENILVRKLTNDIPQAIIADLGFASRVNKDFEGPGTNIYAPPEAFFNAEKINKAKADAFSIGASVVSMYLKDVPPRTKFTQGSSREGYGSIYFSKKMFQDYGFPVLAADFVQRLCWPDPAQRMTLQQAVLHPFLFPDLKPNDYFQRYPFPVDPTGQVTYVVHSAMAMYGVYSAVPKSMNVPTPVYSGLAHSTPSLDSQIVVPQGPQAATVYTVPRVDTGSSSSSDKSSPLPQSNTDPKKVSTQDMGLKYSPLKINSVGSQ